PAYMIVEVETTDEALMAEYRKHTPGLVAKFGGKFIVRGGKTRTLEGGWAPARVVVLEFPDYAAAERFYDSPEYKPVLEMRLKAGRSKATMVEGQGGWGRGLPGGRHVVQCLDDGAGAGSGDPARRADGARLRIPPFPPPAPGEVPARPAEARPGRRAG